MSLFSRSPAIKLDQYEIDVLINGLYQHRDCYGNISAFLLRLVNESEQFKNTRKRKIVFQPDEKRLIRTCLLDWRNEQIQAEKQGAAEAITELLEKFI